MENLHMLSLMHQRYGFHIKYVYEGPFLAGFVYNWRKSWNPAKDRWEARLINYADGGTLDTIAVFLGRFPAKEAGILAICRHFRDWASKIQEKDLKESE